MHKVSSLLGFRSAQISTIADIGQQPIKLCAAFEEIVEREL